MNRILTLLCAIMIAMISMSCHREEHWDGKAKRTVLVYAVASNNLSSYLTDDKNEMIVAAPDVAGLGDDVRLIVYSVPSQSAAEATLEELKLGKDGNWSFVPVKSYDRNTFSTDPVRMREVFSDVQKMFPSTNYGLIFWSHGTSWLPNFTDHSVPDPSGLKKSFGMDKYQGAVDYCDIDELANAVPDRMFDYIWFDLCLMMGVEVVYQLRDKCDYIAGYPTEDWGPGMNYESTLPMLVAPVPNLVGAANSFFEYYMDKNMAVTVSVISTSGLEKLASATAAIYANGTLPSDSYGLMNYSRLSTPLYDFGQYTRKYLDASDPNNASMIENFASALKALTVYARCSTKDFNNKADAFDPQQYSGLSCYFPGSSDLKKEEYYRTLDWAKAVYP